jgi:hypothetical protein
MIGIFALERLNNFVAKLLITWLANSPLFAAIFALFLSLSSTNLLKQRSGAWMHR